MSGPASSMLQAAKLWEKTSAAGNTYLIGRLGGVRILILRNRDAGSEGEPDWHLFFADGSDKASTAATAAKPAGASRPYAARRAYWQPPGRPEGAALPKDGVDDLYRGGER